MLLWAIVFLVLWLVSAIFLGWKYADTPPWGFAVLLMLGILGWFVLSPAFAGK
jgi:hypothetical protein